MFAHSTVEVRNTLICSKMEGIIICCLLVTLQNLVSCQVQEATKSPDPLQTSTRDPYANVLSQLSDVMFNVEDSLYRLTAPKQESENLKAPSDEEKDNRRKNYFDRIRDNYKTLQDQLDQSLSSSGIIRLADILNLNFQNQGARSSLDLSLPFLPLSIKVDSKKPPTKKSGENTHKEVKDSQFSDISGNINLGIEGISDKGAPELFQKKNQKNVKPEMQKRSGRPIRSASGPHKKVSNKGKSSTELFGDSSKSYIEESKDWEDESRVQGRILGDLLFSEATFDKYFKRLLKDHGKWMFDSSIFPPKEIVEGIRGVTRDQFTTGASSKGASQKEKSGGMSSSSKKEQSHRGHQHPGSWRHDAETRIVLAFTPDGLPLKLKIDPSVDKPLKFLHKILSEGKVSLNIPVSTTNGIHPAGNGVLQLGFDDSGTASRTPLLDLSDNNQLNYLLRTLNKLEHEHL